ncbi:MAG: TetR/AcrR family transcriptional regulator [Parvibaculum sp.]
MGLEGYRRRVSEAKRKSIMDAARAEFQGSGFTHAAMAEIARKADVSTATLYKHFGSKEELFSAVVDASYANMNIGIEDAETSKTAKDALTKAAESYLNMQFGMGLNALMRAVISETPGDPQVGRDFYTRGVLKRHEEVKAILDKLVERKLLKAHDTAVTSRQFAGMVKESLIWPAMFDPDFKLPANKDKVISEALDTLLARYAA